MEFTTFSNTVTFNASSQFIVDVSDEGLIWTNCRIAFLSAAINNTQLSLFTFIYQRNNLYCLSGLSCSFQVSKVSLVALALAYVPRQS